MTPNFTGKADIHIHSIHSDGAADIPQILEYASTHTDLNIIAITDHDTMEGSLRARDLAHRYRLEVVPGMEISSAHGHILALFIETPVAPGLPAAETVARIHEQNGLAVAAHAMEPFSPGLFSPWPRWLRFRDAAEVRLDALEAFNASVTIPPLEWLGVLGARHLGAAVTAGSDAHYLGTIGLGITRFPGHTSEDLRRAILQRATQIGGAHYALRHYAGHLWHRRLSHTRPGIWASRRWAPAYARVHR